MDIIEMGQKSKIVFSCIIKRIFRHEEEKIYLKDIKKNERISQMETAGTTNRVTSNGEVCRPWKGIHRRDNVRNSVHPTELSNAGLVILPAYSNDYGVNTKDIFSIDESRNESKTSINPSNSKERFNHSEGESRLSIKRNTVLRQSIIRLSYDISRNTLLDESNHSNFNLLNSVNEQWSLIK